MKWIPSVLLVVVCAFHTCVFTSAPLRAQQQQQQQQQTHEQWLAALLNEAKSVKEGMSRADLLRLFEIDGGVQRIPANRYVLKSCRLIQVEVDFDTGYGRSYQSLPDADLRIVKISAPYLAHPAFD